MSGNGFDGEMTAFLLQASMAFHGDLLSPNLRQPIGNDTPGDIRPAAWRESDQESHWSRRIGLRHRDRGRRWECGSARCQMQKLSAGKFHSITWSVVAAGVTTGESITPQNAGPWPSGAAATGGTSAAPATKRGGGS